MTKIVDIEDIRKKREKKKKGKERGEKRRGRKEKEREKMSGRADEEDDDIIAGADKRAFLMEHAKVILDDKAIESLAQL